MNNYTKENYITKDTPEDHPTKTFIEENSKYIKGKVLDFGCNRGNITMFMEPHASELNGVDINQDAIKLAKTRYPEYTWKCSSLQKIDLPSTHYDTITTFHTLEHIYEEDLPDVIQEAARLLKLGGHLLISVPHKDIGFITHAHDQHVTIFDLNKFSKLFEENFHEVSLEIEKYNTMQVINAVYKKNK